VCICFMPDSEKIVKRKDKGVGLIDIVSYSVCFPCYKTTCPSKSFGVAFY
jgi:hypothetical protein